MVDIKNLRVGTLIKIRDDISLSIEKFGKNPIKLKMPGTIQQIANIRKSVKRIYISTDEKYTTSFHINDLDYVSDEKYKTKKIKPIIFDPEQLVL